jgi:PhnB protein
LKANGGFVTLGETGPVISVILAVPDAPSAVAWYERALGATQLWNLGSVAGLTLAGAAFFVGEPANNGWESPARLGTTSARIEVFCDDPDALIARTVSAGANGSIDPIRNHAAPWGDAPTGRLRRSVRSSLARR